MHFLLFGLLLGLACGLIACVYSVILTEPNMLLNGWYNWLDKKIGPTSAKRTFNTPLHIKPPKNIGKPRAIWLFKPLVGCPRCVAGQAGVWLYLLAIVAEHQKYSIFGHLLCASVSIFTVLIYAKIYAWSRKA